MGDELDGLLGLGADSTGSFGHEDHDRESETDSGAVLETIPVELIEPNGFQPRERFSESELDALAESISEVGVLQPVLVRQIDEARYELIAGERRWRAAKRAGLVAVPAIIRTAGDRDALEQAVVENLHRADLNPLEEAGAYRQLIEDFSMTQDDVAKRVGKSRSAVANLLRLFQLPAAVQRLIAADQLGAGHGRALLALPDRQMQEAVAARVVRDGLSVRAVEELVRSVGEEDGRSPLRERNGSAGKPAALLEVEEDLADRLATRVEVSLSGNRGRLVVEFADLTDLDRIYRLLS